MLVGLQTHHTAVEGSGPRVVVRRSWLVKEDIGLVAVLRNRLVGENHLAVMDKTDLD